MHESWPLYIKCLHFPIQLSHAPPFSMPVYPTHASSASAPLHPHPIGVATHTMPSTPEPAHSSNSRVLITDRMVRSVMALTIVELEEDLIPAQGAGDILHVHDQDQEITHDVRRTLEVFDGDMNEAIDSIRTFVTEGLIDDASRP